MRYGIALDLHATAETAGEVAWHHVREQALTAERLGLDIVVLPDHLSYRVGGAGDYALPDLSVGVREGMAVAAAVAATTTTIDVGHSVINAPYRPPALLAHAAAAIADIADGRYSLGIGVGNSFDYDQLGIDADHRVDRFEECVQIVAGLLHDGRVHIDGSYWRAHDAELVLRPTGRAPAVVVAAGGPRTMKSAARYGDGWNGWCPTDPEDESVPGLLELLDEACGEIDRDPTTITRTGDLAVDPLDARGARARSIEALERLATLGFDEVRCYTVCDASHRARLEALEAFAEMIDVV